MAQAVSNSALTGCALQSRCIPNSPPSSASFVKFNGLRADPFCIKVSVESSRTRPNQFVVKAATTVAPSFTKLKPLGDRILIKIQNAEEKTSGGILLPTSAQSKPQGGDVVAVGEGRAIGDKKIPVAIETGKHIVYSKYAGTEVEFNGAPHMILKEDDVVGILETDDAKDLQPLGDRVLIKVTESESKTAGGVLLTESAKEKPVVGTIVATGPGPLGEDGSRKPLEVSPGNTVLYAKFAGNDFKSKDGSDYVVLKAQDIMAILS